MRKIAIVWGVLVVGCAVGVALSWGASADENALRSVSDARAAAVLDRISCTGFTPADGKYLHDLIVRKGYRTALNVGTANGCSAIWFGEAMRRTGGRVTTIEINPARAAAAERNFADAGLADVIESRAADAIDDIPRLAGGFDFVFMDTGVSINKRLLEVVYARVNPGGAIVSHNAFFAILNERAFLRALRSAPDLRTELVPTRSGGMSVSLKAGGMVF